LSAVLDSKPTNVALKNFNKFNSPFSLGEIFLARLDDPQSQLLPDKLAQAVPDLGVPRY
jgi:hypothetical protein